MNAEDRGNIETKSLGDIRVVRVDMPQRMYQNSKQEKEPIKRQNVKKARSFKEEQDDINVLLQQIQAKRDAIFMKRQNDGEHLVESSKKIEEIDDEEEYIPSFKRRYVQPVETIPTSTQEEEAYRDIQARETYANKQREEIVAQPFHEVNTTIEGYRKEEYAKPVQPVIVEPEEIDKETYINELRNVVMDTKVYEEELTPYVEKRHMRNLKKEKGQTYSQLEEHVEKNTFETRKLFFYTILILLVDSCLILLLHSKGSLFGPSDVDDMTRYLCIALKYAFVIHMFVTLFTLYKDRKQKRKGRV